MDKWTEKEIDRVQIGGNKALKEFIESHDAFDETWSFEEKYQSQVLGENLTKIT